MNNAVLFIVLLTPFSLPGFIERYYPDKDQEIRPFIDFEIDQDPFYCAPLSPPPMFLHYFPIEDLPAYIGRGYVVGHYEEGRVDEKCLDCGLYKGSTHKEASYRKVI